jgi:hypothetical protein
VAAAGSLWLVALFPAPSDGALHPAPSDKNPYSAVFLASALLPMELWTLKLTASER